MTMIPAAHLHQAFSASSFSASVDMLANDVNIANRSLGVAALRIGITVSSATTVSVITKDSSGSVLASSKFQAGSTVNANAAYAWVYLINNVHTYNLQIGTATTSVTGQVDIAEAPLF